MDDGLTRGGRRGSGVDVSNGWTYLYVWREIAKEKWDVLEWDVKGCDGQRRDKRRKRERKREESFA